MLPILQIGPLAIQTPGLILILATWLGLDLAERHALRLGFDPSRIYNLAFVSIGFGLLGARLGYALQRPAAFIEAPLGLLTLSPQMLDPASGLIAAGLAGLIYLQRNHQPMKSALDAITSALSVLAAGIGFAHLASGDAFGAPTNLPWAINLFGELRHPSQLYEIGAAFLILILLWPAGWNPIQRIFLNRPGVRFWLFLGLTALSRVILEAFRADSVLIFESIRQAQVMAWFVLAVSLFALRRSLFSDKPGA